MATIKLAELNNAGSELFQDSESFLNDLNEVDSISVQGGYDSKSSFSEYGDLGVKYLEYVVTGYAIANIKGLAKSFSHSDHY
jgi:hypothetical protein